MRTPIAATLAFAAVLTPALAEQRYDRRLEVAAIRIVAAKMGALRGAFGLDERPVFVISVDATPSTRSTGTEGPTGPVDARPGRSNSF
jgi:hypothetical protein